MSPSHRSNPSRRQFLRASSGVLPLFAGACIARPLPVRFPDRSSIPEHETGTLVNDIHSQLNQTRVGSIVKPATVEDLAVAVRTARDRGDQIAIAGGRHAMGGQQFRTDGLLLDTRALDRVIGFDAERGIVEVEGGIQWPALMAALDERQQGHARRWGIVQKQTGADRLSLGGALACNAHGRGLALEPLIDQVESFRLIDADGEERTCSRTENRELFGLAIGGYGLFGIVTSIRLRLGPRVKVRRVVEVAGTDGLMDRFEARIRDGYLYGDFQFATDDSHDTFMRRGVFSCYQPVPDDTALTPDPARLSAEDWARLTFYSHRYKRRAFEVYSSRYLETSGQIYWSDDQLAASYVDDYHTDLDRALEARGKATEMITEIYVTRPQFHAFMQAAADMLRRRQANLIYGTVRLIERDEESFLAWARERYACVIFNLHVEHSPEGRAGAAEAFRELIDLGIAHGGSYYLTYHRWARRDQVERCYPQMPTFLARKRQYDPDERFQSDWYRHYRDIFTTKPTKDVEATSARMVAK